MKLRIFEDDKIFKIFKRILNIACIMALSQLSIQE